MLSRIAFTACVLFLRVCAGADTIWDYQEVRASDGLGIHPLVDADPEEWNRVTIEGVALAGVDEILDPALMYTVFVQDDTADLGGLQAWAGSWWYGGQWRPAEYVDFQAGDKVRVTGLLSNHNGKVFINDRHSPSPQTRFVVEVLGHVGMPDPLLIPSVGACNYFDATRAGGGERYQTRWVMLHGVEITGGTWGPDQVVTISDASGSVGMLPSGMGDFAGSTQPTGKLNVVGIFDQEDPSSPYFDDYRVWVKKQADIAVAFDLCILALQAPDGTRVALVGKQVMQKSPGEFTILDASGAFSVLSDHPVTQGDIVAVQGIKNGSTIEARYVTVLSNTANVKFEADLDLPLYVGTTRIPVTVWLYDETAGGEIVHTYHPVSYGDSGAHLTVQLDVPKDSGRQYRVRAKASHWLATEHVFTAGGDQHVTWQFVTGDADGDNQVGLGDLNQVLVSFASTDNPDADVDGDGTVGLGDLNVVLINFAKTGAP